VVTKRLPEKVTGPSLCGESLCRLTGTLCTLAGLLLLVGAGCQNSNLYTAFDDLKQRWSKAPPPPPAPVDNFVMRGGGLEKDETAAGTVNAELEGAKTLYAQGKYAEAERIFHRIARNTKNPMLVAEEALFFEGDCLYLQGHYPKAESTFTKLLKDFRINGRFHDQATRRVFDIANYWLDDTRKEMKRAEERRVNKANWFVSAGEDTIKAVTFVPSLFHVEKEKPFLDVKGHALEALEEVRLNDISGPLGEKALFYIGTVKFYDKDFKDADYYYTQVYENYPNGELAATAIKHSIICKQMMTGGSVYDLRGLDQARKVIQETAKSYAQIDEDFLRRQLVSISQQHADKDWRIAEFYRRTGHPGSAYFYYELVKRRYPGTSYSEKAIARMDEMRDRLEKQKARSGIFGDSPADFSGGGRSSIFGGMTPGSGMPGGAGPMGR
jgi:outer membrane protein assembly factor BamD (BamD/ComL family)